MVHDFDPMYDGTPPWDIGRPQSAFKTLADDGRLYGFVLDAGCGTGEHALMAAAHGLRAMGIDASPKAIARAKQKAADRDLDVDFQVADALDLPALGQTFDTILDCGLFHIFDDKQRARYVRSLTDAVPPGGTYFMLCFSDREPPGFGPRRISRKEIEDSFRAGWTLVSAEPAILDVNFTSDGVQAWLAEVARA